VGRSRLNSRRMGRSLESAVWVRTACSPSGELVVYQMAACDQAAPSVSHDWLALLMTGRPYLYCHHLVALLPLRLILAPVISHRVAHLGKGY